LHKFQNYYNFRREINFYLPGGDGGGRGRGRGGKGRVALLKKE